MAIGWGIGDWGGIGGTDDTSGAALDGTPWGGVADAELPAPTLDGVTSPLGASTAGGQLVDILGGDVLLVVGANFESGLVIEVLSGASGGPYTVEGTCYMFDERYDLGASSAYVGAPALAAGLYHVRVTTTAGTAVLEDALDYRAFAHQLKIERVRLGLAKPWETGARYLSGNR